MTVSPAVRAAMLPPVRLSGDWQVCALPLDAAFLPDEPAQWRSVPECAHLQPALYPDRPYWGEHLRAINRQAWFYRRVFVSPDMPYRRARLRFDGVDYFASVWLNSEFVGQHEGAFVPFTFDITRLLQSGDNELTVRVSSPWDAPNPHGTYPTDHVIRGLVKGLYEHGEGVIPPDVNPIGIWRPVWLMLDDGIGLDQVCIRSDHQGRVNLRATISNATGEAWNGRLDVRVAGETHDGPGAELSRLANLLPGVQTIELTFDLSEPHPWWPWDHGPADLYRLELTLRCDDGRVLSQHQETFGLRTVHLERSPEQFTYRINDRPVYLRGSSYIPALYLSQVSPESLARDLAFARDANLNLLRAHVHVSPPEFYDRCDRAGMLVWQDFELNWIQDTSLEFESRARRLQQAMIDHLGNHPSIITWACHNEPTMVFTRRQNYEAHPDPALYADAVQQDPTRPVFICSGQMEDDWQRAGDAHCYYGAIWTARYTDIYPHRFRLNTEFGFEAPAVASTLRRCPDVWERLSHLGGQIDDLWTYQAALVQYQVEHLRRLRADGCAGYVHFWLADLVPQVGCGVLDSERQPKGGYETLRQASLPLQVALEHDGRRPRALWVFNDTPRTYPNVTVRWQVYGVSGNLLLEDETAFAVEANQSQWIMDTDWSLRPADCARVELSLLDANSSVLASNCYTRPFQPLRRPRGYPWKFDPYLGTKVFDRPGAPSLANQSRSPLVRLVPLAARETIAEWALRQHWPAWLVSALSRLLDRALG